MQELMVSGAGNIKFEQLQTIYEIDKQNEINSLKIKQHRISQQIMITGILLALLLSIAILWFYDKIRYKNLELKKTNASKALSSSSGA
jgi:Na+-transporting NADH:ubiquinone oxidoreductase subunit NqrB